MSSVPSRVEDMVKLLKTVIDDLDDELVRQFCIAIAQQISP